MIIIETKCYRGLINWAFILRIFTKIIPQTPKTAKFLALWIFPGFPADLIAKFCPLSPEHQFGSAGTINLKPVNQIMLT